MPTLVILHELYTTTVPVDQDITTIGRRDERTNESPDVDIEEFSLDDSISRQHARVVREGDTYFIEDIGSTNGTFLNGERLMLHFKVPLTLGDRIRLGERMEIIFE